MIDAGPSNVGTPRALALVEGAIGKVCSAAVIHVQRASKILCEAAFGEIAPGGPATTPDAVFDLASLTKIAVATSLLTLLDQRRFALDDPIIATLPEFGGRDPRREVVTFRHLLTHTSGLPPSVNARAEPGMTHVMSRVCATPLMSAPGERVVYSDCGFILVGEAVSRLAGVPLPIAVQTLTFDPLAIGSSGYNPRGEIIERVVCTEQDAWRARLLRGEVHDETCWSMGGVAGHAGLFGTAADVAKLGEMFRQSGQYGGRRVLARPTAQTAVREHARSADERRGLGWALKPNGARPWGNSLGDDAYGHTGYTGTSLFIDPRRALTIVLLTNRVHVSRVAGPIADLRSAVNNAVIEDLERPVPPGRQG